MKLSHFLYAIYFFIISNSFFLFIFGEKGLFAYYQLIGHEETLIQNIENLQEKNRNLANELQWIRSDPEAIKVLARELGYYEIGESVIKIGNYKKIENYYELGKVIKFVKTELIKNNYLRVLSLILSIVLLVVFLIVDRKAMENKDSAKRVFNDHKAKFREFYSKDNRNFKKA